MLISEIFCSLSGESLQSGLRAIFIRTYGCNLACSFCDSIYSWQGGCFRELSVDDILKEIEQYQCKKVVFTGGEPLLQKDALDLVKCLSENRYGVEVETNGAVDIKPLKDLMLDNVMVTMDWKCKSSGEESKMIESNLKELDFDDVLKFVVSDKQDLKDMTQIRCYTDAQIIVSPVFGKIELVDIANYILDNKLNDVRLQVQLHKLVWDSNARGV